MRAATLTDAGVTIVARPFEVDLLSPNVACARNFVDRVDGDTAKGKPKAAPEATFQ
jgi:hypothetical protein